MEFNYGIIAAIIVQAIVRKFSLIAGAIVGFLITTGILIWGLSVYEDGEVIAFGGALELSSEVFIGICILWYAFDAWEFFNAKKTTDIVKDMLGNPDALAFAQATLSGWSSGRFATLDGNYAKKAEKFSPETFLKNHPILEPLVLHRVLNEEGFEEGEIYLNDTTAAFPEVVAPKVEFVVTDQRLIYKKQKGEKFESLKWADIASVEKAKGGMFLFVLKNGEEITLPARQCLPPLKTLQQYIELV